MNTRTAIVLFFSVNLLGCAPKPEGPITRDEQWRWNELRRSPNMAHRLKQPPALYSKKLTKSEESST